MEELSSSPVAFVTYRMTLEYDGGGFAGWQRQPGQRTVEGTLIDALVKATGETPRLTAAGRTDAGAHSRGQVVGCTLSVAWKPNALRAALNSNLPADVAVTSVVEASPEFHARFNAKTRTYRYVVAPGRRRPSPLTRRHAWTVPGSLDVSAMESAAATMVGEHDFGAFGSSPWKGGTTLRTVYGVSVSHVGVVPCAPEIRDGVIIEVTANAFLYGMMRSLCAALVRVGQGRMNAHEVGRMLQAPTGRFSHSAPAQGLFQWRVEYDPHDSATSPEEQ